MNDTLKRRPWWVAALLGGGAAGATLVAGIAPRGDAHVAAASLAQPSQDTLEATRWRERMEAKIDALTEKVAKIEGRLEKR